MAWRRLEQTGVTLFAALLLILVLVHVEVDHAGGTPSQCAFMLKADRPSSDIAGLTERTPGGGDAGHLQSISFIPLIVWTNGFLRPEPPLIALQV